MVHFIDRDPKIFKYVIEYLRGNRHAQLSIIKKLERDDRTKYDMILAEFEYFCINILNHDTIQRGIIGYHNPYSSLVFHPLSNTSYYSEHYLADISKDTVIRISKSDELLEKSFNFFSVSTTFNLIDRYDIVYDEHYKKLMQITSMQFINDDIGHSFVYLDGNLGLFGTMRYQPFKAEYPEKARHLVITCVFGLNLHDEVGAPYLQSAKSICYDQRTKKFYIMNSKKHEILVFSTVQTGVVVMSSKINIQDPTAMTLDSDNNTLLVARLGTFLERKYVDARIEVYDLTDLSIKITYGPYFTNVRNNSWLVDSLYLGSVDTLDIYGSKIIICSKEMLLVFDTKTKRMQCLNAYFHYKHTRACVDAIGNIVCTGTDRGNNECLSLYDISGKLLEHRDISAEYDNIIPEQELYKNADPNNVFNEKPTCLTIDTIGRVCVVYQPGVSFIMYS